MLLDKTIELALCCHKCGRLEKTKINIFELRNGHFLNLKCSCGCAKARIKKKGENHLQFEYNCVLCDGHHRRLFDQKKFWSFHYIDQIKCLETGLEIGFYGPSDLIDDELNKQKNELEIMADELGLNDYQKPELLLEVFNIVHDRATLSKLYCECGSDDIDVKLYFNKIELKCRNCGSTLNIFAETEEQLNEIKNKDKIIIKNKSMTKSGWSNNKYKGE